MKKWKVPKVEIPSHDGIVDIEDIENKHANNGPTETNYKVSRSNPLYMDGEEKDYYEVVSLSSGYYSTYKRGVSQYESVTEDSLSSANRDPLTSSQHLSENSLSRSSDQMPDLSTKAANVIFNKELNGSDSCNWYLLKKLGDTNSNFSTYKPSIHRTSAMLNGARIEGVLENYHTASKDSITRIICKFFCVTILVVLFVFIIIIVSVVVSSGRTIFGSM